MTTTSANLPELVASIQEMTSLLTCVSCSKLSRGAIVLPKCCGNVAYCSQGCLCSLRHCLGCDGPVPAEGLAFPLPTDIPLLESLLLKQTTYERRGGGTIYLGDHLVKKQQRERRRSVSHSSPAAEEEELVESQGFGYHSSQEREARDELTVTRIELQQEESQTEASQSLKQQPQRPSLAARPAATRQSADERKRSDSTLQARKRRRRSRTPKRKVADPFVCPDIHDDSLSSVPSTFDLSRHLKQSRANDEFVTLESIVVQKEDSAPQLNESHDSMNLSLPNTIDMKNLLDNFSADAAPPDTEPNASDSSDSSAHTLTIVVESLASRRHADACRHSNSFLRFVQLLSKETTHFVTTTLGDNKTCRRTMEYLKTMALGGIQVVDSDWLLGLTEEVGSAHAIWGDSSLAERRARLLEEERPQDDNTPSENPYDWFKSTEWWSGNASPCQVALKRNTPLLVDYSMYILDDESSTPLHPEQLELICVLAGAKSILSLHEQDLKLRQRSSGKLILLVSDATTRDSLQTKLEQHKDSVPAHANIVYETTDSFATFVVKQSWLIDSISASFVAPLDLYALCSLEL